VETARRPIVALAVPCSLVRERSWIHSQRCSTGAVTADEYRHGSACGTSPTRPCERWHGFS